MASYIEKLSEEVTIRNMQESGNSLSEWGRNLISDIKTVFRSHAYKMNKNCMQLIYSNTLAAAATSITVSGLDGDNEVMYMIIAKCVSGKAGGSTYCVTCNASGGNYGSQYVTGANNVASAARDTTEPGMMLGYTSAITNQCMSVAHLYAKSGTLRMMTSLSCDDIAPAAATTIGYSTYKCSVWDDTTTNITSLVFKGSAADVDFGVGTRIEVWCR